MAVIIILAVIAFFVIGVAVLYNGLVRLRNLVEQADSDITIQLKRRYDLIPNLIEATKGYMDHERQTLEAVTNARVEAINQTETNSLGAQKAENILEGALKSLFAVAENYPDLKASQNFGQLQDELVDTENKVSASRRFFNGSLKSYSDKLQIFPSNLIAGIFNFNSKKYRYFELDEAQAAAAAEAPKVSFN